jgi:hypothetical protein
MSRAATIAQFYGQGKEARNGAGWISLCPIHGDSTPSLSITDRPAGDDVDVFCHVGCDWKEIKDRFRADGLLPEWTPEKKNGATSPHASIPAPSKPPQDEEPSFVWQKASRDDMAPVVAYFAGRAITIDPLPICLRFNSYTAKDGERISMVVAAVTHPGDQAVYAVQRLFLDLDANPPVKSGARMKGECHGRGVWFDRKGDKHTMVIGEGIETTLSAMQATGKNGVAALSTSGLKGIILPEETNVIYILVDSDPRRDIEAKSMPGQKAAVALARRFVDADPTHRAFLVTPDDTCFTDAPAKLDFNDILKADPTGGKIRERFAQVVEINNLEWQPGNDDQTTTAPRPPGDDRFPPETLKALQDMNREYAGVMIGGDFRVVQEGYDHAARKHTLTFLKLFSLYNYHLSDLVPVYGEKNIEYQELAKLWMRWDGKRRYNNVVFDPTGKASPNAYNLFRGFPLTPKQGDWSLMRAHIRDVICDSNEEHFAYLMAWMARAVQDPGGERPGVAVVLKGGKGIGKGVFVNYFGAIFGEAFLPISDSDSFTGRFNMHLSKSLLVFLDEAVWGGDKKAEGKLKQLITEPTVLFEPKGIDSITLRNYINVIIAGNEEWIVPATGDERRFFVLEPSEAFQRDTDYFGRIAYERDHGGVEAMMYDLMHHDYSAVNLRVAPTTEGLCSQVEQSLPSAWEFWQVVFDRGFLLSDDRGAPAKTTCPQGMGFVEYEFWPAEVWRYEVYAEYSRWCGNKNERYIDNERRFWMNTWKIWPGGCPVRTRKRVGSQDAVSLVDTLKVPKVEECQSAFSAATKIVFSQSTVEQPWESQF